MSALFEAGLIISGALTDFDEMAASDHAWDQRYHQLGKGPFLGCSTIVHSDCAQLAHTSYQPGIFIEGSSPQRAFTFLSQTAGAPVYSHGACLEDNELMLLRPGEEFHFTSAGPCEIIVLSVSTTLFDQTLQSLAQQEIGDICHQHRLRLAGPGLHTQLNRCWSGLLARVCSDPALLTAGGEAIETQLLEPIIGIATRDSTRHRAINRRLANTTAMAAAGYIREHAGQPIRIYELCSRLGVSERTLQIGFRSCFGCTPKAFITAMRFNRVRRELAGAPAGLTVSDVATHRGFTELGRFAVEYRRMFGESPSTTLQLHRRPPGFLSSR